MPLVLIGRIREKANNISSGTQETVSEDAEVEPRKNYPITIMDNSLAVSYTHLTLPTILLV
mgnify:CR=1 FL=1